MPPTDKTDHRGRMEQQFGVSTVRQAEHNVLCALALDMFGIKPAEFAELVRGECQKMDDRRREQVQG